MSLTTLCLIMNALICVVIIVERQKVCKITLNCTITRMTLRFALIGSLIMSVIISVAIFELSGCERVFQANVMTDYVQNAVYIQISNYVFYAIPLISSIFYLAVFNSLRLRRADAISAQTKALLDKAERCSLKQGLWILTTYLVSCSSTESRPGI
ncbi:hypothetical protein OESDEN_00714 [Oesophagostomum dentatum]|uniref:Uncharacterized protein n=1 Tax=Oesophagostomum dentatum TaxID=61180 RepID=A0A0B1TPV6_OESDE|nr:hypothetical protein OESDEN_00714 [Oesophagostomum dentatum]